MKFDFSNQVILITGAAGMLGNAVARKFYEAGAKLSLVDLSSEKFSTLYPELVDSADYLFAPATDVADPDSVAAMVTATDRRFGKIDVLVNTVGGYRAGTPVHETPLSEWDLMLKINALSVLTTCRAVIPHFLRQKHGKIINIASRAALGGSAHHAAYSVSKTAVVRLTETMAAELKDAGINVNCLMPGVIDTPPNRTAMPDADFSTWVTTDAVADVILFLASDLARAVNGAAIPVYGRG